MFWLDPSTALYSVAEMNEADRLTIKAGISSLTLMETAGLSVARIIKNHLAPVCTLVLCGPGNNGGDGFIIGRILKELGWEVRVGLLGTKDQLKGDVALAADGWTGILEFAAPNLLEGTRLVVDAMFGAGLNRELTGEALAIVEAMKIRRERGDCRIVAVDVPSGLDGNTGQILGCVAPADFTVTFHRAKPGHLLMPGRSLCGDIKIMDIGISECAINAVRPNQSRNNPSVWSDELPVRSAGDHKYSRGHALINGGSQMTGAALLAAEAARRVGSGLATITSDPISANIYRSHILGGLVSVCGRASDFEKLLSNQRHNAILIGPGNGVTENTKKFAEIALASQKPVVLDADALTVFSERVEHLARVILGQVVITPHEGEFRRLFPKFDNLDKLSKARRAAEILDAVVVLKGVDTVIADSTGFALINENAPPWLATGGSGDILAGTITGLLAQGMSPFLAAAAAVWLNGEAAAKVGPNLLAEDLPVSMGNVFGNLIQTQKLGQLDYIARDDI